MRAGIAPHGWLRAGARFAPIPRPRDKRFIYRDQLLCANPHPHFQLFGEPLELLDMFSPLIDIPDLHPMRGE
jgi:hypothetical protein